MKKIILIRLFICSTLLACWILFRIFYLKNQTYIWDSRYSHKDIILDSIYEYSKIISQHLLIRDYMLIICSTGLDFFLVIFLFIYLIKGRDFRPIKNVFYFYLGRLILNVEYEDEINPNLYSYPGFPSIVMFYNNYSERYVSTYAGLMTIFMLHFYEFGFFKIFYFSFIFAIYLVMTLLLLRANFSIDIIIGIILAHLTYIISESKKSEIKKKNVVITRRVSKAENKQKDVRIDVSKDQNDIYVMNYDQ